MKTFFPLISVIVPNFNHSSYLAQRLDSIFNQTYQNFEVILLDDKSTDASRGILSQYAKNEKVTHCVFNEINSGNTFKQWSKGISLAKGDLIWIAESDDFCELNFLEKVIKPFLDNNQVVLSYCQSKKVDQNNNLTGNWIEYTERLDSQNKFSGNFIMDGNLFIEKFLINKNVIPNASAVVFKKEMIKTDDLDIDSEFRYCGDWIFYFKLIINHKVAFIAESLNNFRYHTNSVIATAIKSENRIRIIDIDFNMRKVFIRFMKKQNLSNSSYNLIKKHNTNVIRELKYEKALLLIESNNIQGYIILLSVFDVFLRESNIRRRIKMKIRNFLK